MMSSNVHTVRDFVSRAADRHGWRLNPDTEHVAAVVEGLSVNLSRFGYYLCPCRDGSNDKRLDSDIICPCDYAQADLDEHGHCYCGLFCTASFAALGKKTEPIPERRPPELRDKEDETGGAEPSETSETELNGTLSNEVSSGHIPVRTITIDVGSDLCSIKDLIRDINELEHVLRSVHKLTLNEAVCLCCISKLIQTPGECAEQMGLSPSRISRILNSLERKKLIERHLMLDNLRSTELKLTEAGEEGLKRLRLCGFSFSKLDRRPEYSCSRQEAGGHRETSNG